MKAWKLLVQKYADGRPICNCGAAYLTPCGHGFVTENGVTVKRTDMLTCQHGCSSNCMRAQEEIAQRILAEQ